MFETEAGIVQAPMKYTVHKRNKIIVSLSIVPVHPVSEQFLFFSIVIIFKERETMSMFVCFFFSSSNKVLPKFHKNCGEAYGFRGHSATIPL